MVTKKDEAERTRVEGIIKECEKRSPDYTVELSQEEKAVGSAGAISIWKTKDSYACKVANRFGETGIVSGLSLGETQVFIAAQLGGKDEIFMTCDEKTNRELIMQ